MLKRGKTDGGCERHGIEEGGGGGGGGMVAVMGGKRVSVVRTLHLRGRSVLELGN